MIRKNLQSRPMSDAHIHAYVDGQLKQERGQSLQTILGDIPEKYEQLEEYQRINENLRSTLRPILQEPIPNSILMLFKGMETHSRASKNQASRNSRATTQAAPQARQTKANVVNHELKSEIKKPKEKSKEKTKENTEGGVGLVMENDLDYKYSQLRSFGSALRTIPIIVIFCIISFIVGWNVRNNFTFSEERVAEFVNRAINSDNIFIGENPEITELRNLDRVIRKRFTRPIHIPDSRDLSLKGGRILPYGESGSAAMLIYTAQGKDVSLYFNQVPGLVNVEIPYCEKIKPKTVCYWHRGDMNFIVISSLKEESLRGVAKTFLQQLLHNPGTP